MKEMHMKFIRNEARSKVEVIFIKDGWLSQESNENSATTEDAYIIRVWGMKVDGQARVNEIKLRASEMNKLRLKPLEIE